MKTGINMGAGASNGGKGDPEGYRFKTDMTDIADIYDPNHIVTRVELFKSNGRIVKHSWIVGRVKCDNQYYFSLSKFSKFVGFFASQDYNLVVLKGKGKEAKEVKHVKTIRTSRKIGKTIAYAQFNIGQYKKIRSNCNDYAKLMMAFFE